MPDDFLALLEQSQGQGGSRDDLLRALMLFALSKMDAKEATGPETQPPVDDSFRVPEIRVRPHFTPSPS